MPDLELYGTKTCPYTREARESLEWKGREFREYDVESDPEALRRMLTLTGGQRSVPVLVEDGTVIQIGWEGRACVVSGG